MPAEGAYLLRRQRPARLEKDGKLRGYVLARLLEGWTPEQISGRLGKGIEIGLKLISTEAIYAWVYSKARQGPQGRRSRANVPSFERCSGSTRTTLKPAVKARSQACARTPPSMV